MKKYLFLGAVLGAFLLFFANPSNAILIEFDPASQGVPVGNPVDVDLTISGLGDFAPPSLGAFDLDIRGCVKEPGIKNSTQTSSLN